MERLSSHLEPLRGRQPGSGRPGHSTGALRTLHRQHGFCHFTSPRVAHHYFPALLCSRGHLLRLWHGPHTVDHHPAHHAPPALHHHCTSGQNGQGDHVYRHDRKLRLHHRIFRRLVQRKYV